MPIESANYINQLDPTNPAAPDLLADTDNHLRMIKQVLKNTFPNLNASVSLTPNQLSSFVPIGFIGAWYGNTTNVPAGWGLCNGTTYTRTDGGGTIVAPDLRDRFIKGYSASVSDVGAVGGSVTPAGTANPGGNHSHGGSTDVQGVHNHTGSVTPTALSINQIPPHSHAYTAAIRSSSGTVALGLYASSFEPVNNQVLNTANAGFGDGHWHNIYSDGAHAHNLAIAASGDHTHTVTIADGRPPYMSLCYIMKI